jgi:hypothetical protein
MCWLVNREDFHEPDLRGRGELSNASETGAKYFEQLMEWIDSVEIGQYVHPNAEEYINRVLNTFLYGWYHYPLFTVADTLSFLALELALRQRFLYQATQRKRSLTSLLRRAISEGLLRFEETEIVKKRQKRSKELASIGLPFIKERSAKDIASGRANMVRRLFPEIRGSRVHPDSATLLPPNHVIMGIRQSTEFINIIYGNSDKPLRSLSDQVSFDWADVQFIPHGISDEICLCRTPEFTGLKTIPLSKVVEFIRQLAEFLGILVLNAADQLRIINEFGILPSDPYRNLHSILERKEKDRPSILEDKKTVEGVIWLEHHCIEVLLKFQSRFTLKCSDVKISFDYTKSEGAVRTWKAISEVKQEPVTCCVTQNELSFYLLMKLGIWGSEKNRLDWELRILRKVIGGVSS